MPRALIISPQIWVAAVFAALLLGGTASAQTVWSGFDFSFAKANDAPVTEPENQDRITSNVWLTRTVQQGIYNIAAEDAYTQSLSPVGTAWATYINNPGETIAAANWADLDFEPWVEAYGGPGHIGVPPIPDRLLGGNAVLHLITDNIYLDIQFTSWTSNAGGGGFSYDRAAAPPAPPTTGDYNGNNVVDAADYVVWRDTYGQTATPHGSGADGDLSGMIDDPDYDFWRARFGTIVPAAAAGICSSPVPETSTIFLALGAIGMLVLLPRISPCGPGRTAYAWRFR